MSSQSFANLANSEFNGNIVLNNGYIKFPDDSIQTTAGGGGGGNVSTDQNNTFEVGFTQTFNGSVDITSYTASNIIGQPLLDVNPTIIDSVLLGVQVGNIITNINGTVAIGNNSAYSTITNTNGISIGKDSDIGNGATNNIAIGANASATGNNSVAIGANANTGNNNEILLGTSSNYVKIPNYLQFSDNSIQTTAFSYAGNSITNINGSSTTAWVFNTLGLPNFNILLATNITSFLPQVYTGSYDTIPQSYTFTISSAVLQNTSVNGIFTATNPNAQTQPINFTGLYATGINTIVENPGSISAVEPTDFGTAFFNNVITNTTATTTPYFPAITGNCYLNITTQWNGTDYIVFTSYDFQEINMSSNTTFSVAFVDGSYEQQINVNYTGGNLATPILLQLSIK